MENERLCLYCRHSFNSDYEINLCQHCLTEFKDFMEKDVNGEHYEFPDERFGEIFAHLKNCKWCEELFYAFPSNSEFCSKECKVEHKAHWHSGYYKSIVKPTRTEEANQARAIKAKQVGKTKARFEIFKRDGFKCVYCGRGVNDGVKLQIDHQIPVSRGGCDLVENWVTCCWECNIGKGNRGLKENNAL